jgi:uncharacterized protein involved in outer membrane biogenesis
VTAPPSRWKRRLVVLALVLVGLVALVKLALPPLLASQLADAASQALGRRVEIGGLELRWLPGRVAVTDLQIGGPLDAPPGPPERAPLRLARLGLDLSWGSLLAGEIHLTDLALDAPALFLERAADGSLTPVVLAQSEDEGAQAPPGSGAADGAGWPIRLDAIGIRDLSLEIARRGAVDPPELALALAELRLSDLALRDGALTLGSIAFQDPDLRVQRAIAQTSAPPADVAARPPAGEAATRDTQEDLLERHSLQALDVSAARFRLLWEGADPLEVSLELSARDVSALPGERFPLSITLGLEGGSVGLDGQLGVRPLQYEGVLRWQALPLPRLLDASGVDAGLALASGRSSGELRVALAGAAQGEAPSELELSGQLGVSELDGSLPDTNLAWSKLDVALASLRLPLDPGQSPVVALSRVVLTEPRIDYERVAAPPPAGEAPASEDTSSPQAGAPADAPAPRISLDELVVERGSLHFRDRSPAQPFETRWRDLSVQGRGLRWPERDAESLKLSARGGGGSKLAVDASLRGGRGRIETRIDRLALVPLDAYAQQYTGIRITEGRSSVRSLVEIDEKGLRTDSVVDLHRLDVREAEAGWFKRIFGVPLDLALALLRDLEGDIRVPVRAEFAGEDTDVGMLSLLASTLREAVMGALTSPLKLLGSVKQRAGDALGSGLEPIGVVPGEPSIEASQRERLARLAETLEDKPELQVALRGRAGPADDAGIARRRLIAQARAGESLDGDDQLGFLERRRVRRALAEQDPDAPLALDPDTEALVQKLVTAARVEDAERRELARARATRAREALVDDLGVPEAAVVVEEGAVGEPGVVIELRARHDAPRSDASG